MNVTGRIGPFLVATSYCSQLWPTSDQGAVCNPELWAAVLTLSFYSCTKNTSPILLLVQTDWQEYFLLSVHRSVRSLLRFRFWIISIQGINSCIDGLICSDTHLLPPANLMSWICCEGTREQGLTIMLFRSLTVTHRNELAKLAAWSAWCHHVVAAERLRPTHVCLSSP